MSRISKSMKLKNKWLSLFDSEGNVREDLEDYSGMYVIKQEDVGKILPPVSLLAEILLEERKEMVAKNRRDGLEEKNVLDYLDFLKAMTALLQAKTIVFTEKNLPEKDFSVIYNNPSPVWAGLIDGDKIYMVRSVVDRIAYMVSDMREMYGGRFKLKQLYNFLKENGYIETINGKTTQSFRIYKNMCRCLCFTKEKMKEISELEWEDFDLFQERAESFGVEVE
jgi:hypothetical protein